MQIKRFSKYILCAIFMLLLGAGNLEAQDFYKVSLVRAAPGDLLELIELYKTTAAVNEKATGFKPYILRHSQGDQWDLFVLEYVSEQNNILDRESDETQSFVPSFGDKGSEMIAYHEEFFVKGPDFESLILQFEKYDYYHVEMFIALPDKHMALLKEREMENKYLEYLERPENFIFTRHLGGKWDLFTIGAYRDLTHFAESALIAESKENEAAKKAGFESAGTIGSYLRSLIMEHHDTLANRVN